MNRKEYLLTCLAEEAGEIVQACTKALRFGLDNHGDDAVPNHTKIAREFCDLMGIFEMLQRLNLVDQLYPEEFENKVKEKQNKIFMFMEYSKQAGTLQEDDS